MDIVEIGAAAVGAVVAVAPAITVGVNKFGSPNVKAGWAAVRMIYNRAYRKKMKQGGNEND